MLQSAYIAKLLIIILKGVTVFSEDGTLQQAKASAQPFNTAGDEAKLFVKIGADGTARLDYLVSFLVSENKQLSRPHFFIDANLGTVIDQREIAP